MNRTVNEIIDDIQYIREKNNDAWIELEKLTLEEPNNTNWAEIKYERKFYNKLKMIMIKEAFEKYPDKAKKIFKEITENDRKINELSKELIGE